MLVVNTMNSKAMKIPLIHDKFMTFSKVFHEIFHGFFHGIDGMKKV